VPVKTGTADSHPPEYVIPDDVLIRVGPPDDEHLLLETCRGIRNKYIKKECIKLVITQNRIKMHGQQNIKFYRMGLLLHEEWRQLGEVLIINMGRAVA
jgi:hypothetical protein